MFFEWFLNVIVGKVYAIAGLLSIFWRLTLLPEPSKARRSHLLFTMGWPLATFAVLHFVGIIQGWAAWLVAVFSGTVASGVKEDAYDFWVRREAVSYQDSLAGPLGVLQASVWILTYLIFIRR